MKFRVIDLFDFTGFLAWTFLNFLAYYCEAKNSVFWLIKNSYVYIYGERQIPSDQECESVHVFSWRRVNLPSIVSNIDRKIPLGIPKIEFFFPCLEQFSSGEKFLFGVLIYRIFGYKYLWPKKTQWKQIHPKIQIYVRSSKYVCLFKGTVGQKI